MANMKANLGHQVTRGESLMQFLLVLVAIVVICTTTNHRQNTKFEANLKNLAGQISTVGTPGATGLPGIQGNPGTQGSQGIPGLTGIRGALGATGVAGLRGETGAIGTPGANGLAGTNGTNGTNGNDGTLSSEFASYYTQDEFSPSPLAGNISYNTQNTKLGSHITVSGATITISAVGTYYLSAQGTVGSYKQEAQNAPTEFAVSLMKQEQGGSNTAVGADPLAHYNSLFTDDNQGGILAMTEYNISQIFTVTNAPAVLHVNINGIQGLLYHTNPSLNIFQIK